MAVAILSEGARSRAIEESCLEAFVVGAHDARSFVDDEACHELTIGSRHDACFADVDDKTFVESDAGREGDEAARLSERIPASPENTRSSA